MRRAKAAVMGLMTLVVMLVFGVFSAGSASAQTLYLFLVTGPLPALVLVLSQGPQLFLPAAGSNFVVECKHFGAQGLISTPAGVMWGSTGKLNGKYSECKVKSTGNAAKITEVEYEINAQGSLSLLNDITISVAAAECTLKVISAKNQHLLLLLFLKDVLAPTLALLVHAEVSGIHSTASSEAHCGVTGTLLPTTGTYTGLFLTWVDNGGTIQWMG
jgi:hypothetical protein